MTTVSRTVTVQQSSGGTSSLDNNLDSLLEDLQTSVSRPSSAMNGSSSSNLRSFREVKRIHQETGPSKKKDINVEYLSAANPTTVVQERASSPGIDMLKSQSHDSSNRSGSYQYQYITKSSSQAKPDSVKETRIVKSDPEADARLKQNLHELDNLLVDLHQAQRTGFGLSQGRSTVDNVFRNGPDPELVDSSFEKTYSSTPTQHVSRSVERRTYRTYGRDSSSPIRHYVDPSMSPRLQPKRSSSVQRELTYGTVDSSRSRGHTRSPSPIRRDPSPLSHGPRSMHREVYYETKSGSSPSHYRDKSPSNQRLHRELYNESRSTRLDKYQNASPPPPRRNISPIRPGSDVRTTVRTYNYSSNTDSGSRYPTSPTTTRKIYTESQPIIELPRTPQRSPSPSMYSRDPKVTTTVRTYSYELPGHPGRKAEFIDTSNDDTLTYRVTPREREPLIPQTEPTVITYKYSSHSTRKETNKFPVEEQQHLMPRPFPTPAPLPSPGPDDQPPKRLDDLMASFSDSEQHQQEVIHYPIQKQQAPPPEKLRTVEHNGSAFVPPSPKIEETIQIKQDRQVSKNIEGPPVYYPPGVELFARKEEAAMQKSSKGGYMKEKEKYEYEASSGSKEKSSSGAAVVPVCLPLCCAMPCVIL